MKSRKASIIITSYNQRAYIAEAIESALIQDFSDVEVIVVDDGSQDGSPDYIKKCFGKSIKLLIQNNQGPSAAINVGLRAANGQYIALLGGDDVCHPTRITSQIRYLEEEEADVVFCIPQIIDAVGKVNSDEMSSVLERLFTADNLLKILLTEGNFLCAPTAMLRKSTVEKIGYFKLGLIQLQDYDYWIRCIISGLRIRRMNDRLVSYRRHSENLSSTTRAFATEVEEAGLLADLLDNDSCHLHLRNCFKNLLTPNIDQSALLSDFDKMIISMGHPNRQFRSIGANRAIKSYETPSFRKKIEELGVVFPLFLRNSLS